MQHLQDRLQPGVTPGIFNGVKTNRFGYFTVNYLNTNLTPPGIEFSTIRETALATYALKVEIKETTQGDAEYRVMGTLPLAKYLDDVKTLSTISKPSLSTSYNDKGVEGNSIDITDAGGPVKIVGTTINTALDVNLTIPATADAHCITMTVTNQNDVTINSTSETTDAAVSVSVAGANNKASALVITNDEGGYGLYNLSGATKLSYTLLENETAEIPANATYVKIASTNTESTFTIKNITDSGDENAGRILYITKTPGFNDITIGGKNITGDITAIVMIFDGTDWIVVSEK